MITGHLREKNGRYHMVLNYLDNEGNKKSKSISTGLTLRGNKKRADAMLKVAKKELDEQLQREADPRYHNMLFTDFMLNWLDIIKRNVEATTYASYALIVKRKILPFFEPRKIKLRELRPLDIQNYYQHLFDNENLSANTVIHHHANIRKALQYALQVDLIDKNPADRVEKPKKIPYTADTYNAEEMEELFQAVKGQRIEFAVILGAFYGLRRSEIVGLKWDAIDFKNKTFSIRSTVTEAHLNGKTVIIEKNRTKTKSSCRTLPMVEPFEALLQSMKAQQEEYKAICGNSYCKEYLDYIYVNELGERILPNFVTQNFAVTLKNNNLRKIRFHDLRHSCASLLYLNGVNMKEIQEWLGHSTISTTSNIYTHLNFRSKIESANAILDVYPSKRV